MQQQPERRHDHCCTNTDYVLLLTTLHAKQVFLQNSSATAIAPDDPVNTYTKLPIVTS